jgi:hypothetical protein
MASGYYVSLSILQLLYLIIRVKILIDNKFKKKLAVVSGKKFSARQQIRICI